MNLKGQTSYARGRALNMTNLWNRIKTLDFRKKGGKKNIMNNALEYIKGEKEETIKNLKKITDESREAVEQIRMLNKTKPSMLKPLMLAYEVTDGSVNTISKLNRYFKESTGVFKKAIIAGAFHGWLSMKKQQKISKVLRLMQFPCFDALSYAHLAEGRLDIVLQCANKIWDIHPIMPIVKAAGAIITTWDNRDAVYAGNILVSGNVSNHKKMLKLLKPALK